jgi:sentrin-specific protease 1
VVSKHAREQVLDRDISRLGPSQWLNDEIINFYGALILGRSEESKENPVPKSITNGHKSDGPKALNVHYFSTFFWSKLLADGYEKGRLAKWTKKVCGFHAIHLGRLLLMHWLQIDIFSKDIILIPVNHNNTHWTAAAINFRRKRIESYDSMNMNRAPVYRVRLCLSS